MWGIDAKKSAQNTLKQPKIFVSGECERVMHLKSFDNGVIIPHREMTR